MKSLSSKITKGLLFIFLLGVIQGCVSKKKYAQLMQDREAMDFQITELMRAKSELEAQIAEIRTENDALRNENQQSKKKETELKKEIDLINAQLQQLTSENTNLTPTLPGGYEEFTLRNNFINDYTFIDELEIPFDQLLAAQGYYNNRYFPFRGGFGLMTNIEQINNDGTSKPVPERWSHDVRFTDSGGGFWESFRGARKGRFRMFVFLVTNDVYSESDQVLNFEEANAWIRSGFSTLPTNSERIRISKNHYCDVLVYEFEKSDFNPEGKNQPSGYSAKEHLIKAKLWQSLKAK